MNSARGLGMTNRGAITVSIMLAVIMRGLDNTIANVALPHMQGSLSASREEIGWVLTSYIVSVAITMPLSGWLAGRVGIKYIYLYSVIGFAVASALCGAATSLPELVIFRVLQGIGGAALVPLAQATLLSINPPERHGQAMAVFGSGTILGPIAGPALGIAIFFRDNRRAHREAFDFFGFAALSVAIGAFQLMLDRGAVRDWFASPEIWIEATLAGVSLYLLVVHTATTTGHSFLNRDLLRNAPFVTGTVLVFLIGITMNGTLALLPLMLEQLMQYPVLTTGLVTAPRGIGTMIGMFVVARLINRVDTRLILTIGLCLLAASCWQMTSFSLQMGAGPVIVSGLIQGFGFGFTGVPLNLIALSSLPRHILTQGTAIRGLMRNLGGSTGIPILLSQLTANTQIVHARLIEHLRPDNPLAQPPFLTSQFSLSEPSGLAALNHEVTRQASMVAYIDDFKLMMFVSLASIPLVLLLRRPRPPAPQPAAAD